MCYACRNLGSDRLLEGPVAVLNAKLRGVFGRVLWDYRDGQSAVSPAFSWPTMDGCKVA